MPRFRNTPVDITIDVRTRLEYWLGHLEGAVNIPIHRITEALPAREDIRVDSRILIYCASGARSASAAAALRAMGYKRVIDGGGMSVARQEYRP